MKIKGLLILIVLLIGSLAYSQSDLNKGFQFLENGEWKNAESFFTDYLKTDPSNRTAKLCLGRAQGLLGKSAESKSIFDDLLQEYPNDYEIKLNKAEWFMWNDSFPQANLEYQDLVEEDENSFPARLGLANAQSNLKQYEKAYFNINKSLELSPNNSSATLSKKYILLGYANQKRINGDFGSAHKDYEEIINLFPNDYEASLAQADTYLIQNQPKKTLRAFKNLNTQYENDVTILNGLSYASLVLQKNKDALKYAKEALELADDNDLRSHESYINALGVNRKFNTAFDYVESLSAQTNRDKKIKTTEARLHFWKKDFSDAKAQFAILRDAYPNDFNILVNQGEFLLATKNRDRAIDNFETAIEIDSNNSDLNRLYSKTKKLDRAYMDMGFSIAEDNGDNLARQINLGVDLGRINRIRPYAAIEARNTKFQSERFDVVNASILLGLNYTPSNYLSFGIEVAPSFIYGPLTPDQNLLEYKFDMRLDIFKYHNFTFTIEKSKLNYNRPLTESILVLEEYRVDYNFYHPSGIGFFSQGSYQRISDSNRRKLIYLSPYYLIRKSPNLKIGASYQNISFDQQDILLYFSPEKFSAFEGFISLSNTDSPRAKFLYTGLIGLGSQIINSSANQNTRRLEIDLGYRFDWNREVHIYFRNSNSAQTNIAGFTSSIFGIKIKSRF